MKLKNILILLGGDSNRFWPLEEKSFWSFLGVPLIIFQIQKLANYAEKLIVVASKNNATLLNRLIRNSKFNTQIEVVVQKDDYPGQAGAIISAKNLIKGEVLIVNANDVFDDLIINKLMSLSRQKKIILVGKKKNEYFPGGYFCFDNNKKLIEIVEKPDKNKLPSSIVKLVVDYFYDINLLVETIEKIKLKTDDLYEKALSLLLKGEVERDWISYDSYWQSLKYPWHLLPMTKGFLSTLKSNQIAKTAVVSKKAVIIPPVFIGENVRIGDFSKIVGPTYIGANTVVGDYSMVRESQIGEDCLIGSFSEIARSYIANCVFLHRNYIGDSVLADKVMLGAGAVTGNLRFDGLNVASLVNEEKIDTDLPKLGTIIGVNSKVGINVSVLPGVKIGKDCLISPDEVIRVDLEDRTFLIKGEERENNLK